MQLYRDTYIRPRFFLLLLVIAGSFVLAHLFPVLLPVSQAALGLVLAFTGLDMYLLWNKNTTVEMQREVAEKLSNGDDNPVQIFIHNQSRLNLDLEVRDEAPKQFQLRKLIFHLKLAPDARQTLSYILHPLERGAYAFGDLYVYASSLLGLVSRRFTQETPQEVAVYPSFQQMRRYQLMAISNRLTEAGVKKIRRLGHTSEFEQIKDYVQGDDYRTLNWKASARAGRLMVNQYADERAQNVYCLIDKSRAMKMPFEGMSLLDYAINAALVLSNIAIYKKDKAGLITFAETLDATLLANSKASQMSQISELLYRQETRYLEADYARLYTFVKSRISQRSLLVLFTNFESLSGLNRQLPYLKALSGPHLLMVIIFENTELHSLLGSVPENTEEIYIKTVGEQFAYEKKLIVKEMEKHGIIALLTPPHQLTVQTLNKYLELKSRGMI